ncbi:MAG: hypothetical protein B9S32_02790 [Verrucomicrobia bacterium Tous-C9LFEB]|nr:MAG: hypothetical protein B9S32_02790 [Verrucomicrobia bacterium Tous-C9LFEB]
MARRRREISIYRIAEEAGVSAATVSRVINRRVGVSEATRARIDELLRRYHFLPDYPLQRAPKIAFTVPSNNGLNDYIRKALNGVFHYVADRGIDVSIIHYREKSKTSLLQQIRDQQCSGVIMIIPDHFREEFQSLNDSGLPVILLDSQSDLPKLGYIDNDSYSGSCAAARYLLDLGHRRIGYICHAHVSNHDHRERLRGYKDTLVAAGITPQGHWLAHTPPIKPSEHVRGMAGLRAMELLLKQAPEITAVMALDDDMALGALTAIHQSGRKIPEEISLIGFDNYPETLVWFPALTTVNHPIEQGGYRAAEAIAQAWANPGQWTPPHEILPTHLIVRASTGPAPR